MTLPPMRLFHLDRLEDETGISGTGRIAEGVVFSDGRVAMNWITQFRSFCFYDSVDDLVSIHGHNGKTQLVFDGLPEHGVGIRRLLVQDQKQRDVRILQAEDHERKQRILEGAEDQG